MNLALHRHAFREALPIRLGEHVTRPPDGFLFTAPSSYLAAVSDSVLATRQTSIRGAFSWLDATERSLARLLDFYGWAIAPESRRCTARVAELTGACGLSEVFPDFGHRHSGAGVHASQSLIALTQPLRLTSRAARGGTSSILEPGYGVLFEPSVADGLDVAPAPVDRALCIVVTALGA